VRHGEQLAARDESERVTGGMGPERLEVIDCGNEAARRLGAVRGRADVELARRVARGIEQPQARGALVDDALAVALRVARVEARVVGVAAPVALSNCLWMYCAFLGIARPWNQGVTMSEVLLVGALLFALSFASVLVVLTLASRAIQR